MSKQPQPAPTASTIGANHGVKRDIGLVALILNNPRTCLVVNPITVNIFAVLLNCLPVRRGSDSMIAQT